MPRLTRLLSISILLNLGAAIAYLRTETKIPGAPGATPPPNLAPAPEAPPTDEQIWTNLQSTTSISASLPSADFVARLRAAGFPIDVIRVIVRQQIEDHYAPREAAIAAAHATTNYWETEFGTNAGYRESGPERIAVRLEKNAIMRQLLGDDAETPRERTRRTRDFGAIPIEKVDQFVTLRTEYDHLEIELRRRAQGVTLPADRAELERLRTERENAITALFTADELATYELHAGDPSNDLREKLRWFKPSETEFLNLYTSQLEFDRQFRRGPEVGSPPEERQAWVEARDAAQAQLDADFAAALTPERYADYQLTASPAYRQMRRITDQFELPGELAATMSRSQTAAQTEAETIIADTSVSVQERRAQVEALTGKFSAALADQLTPAALAAYEQAIKRQLQRLRPPPTRPTPPSGN